MNVRIIHTQEQFRKLGRIFVGATTKRKKKTEGEDQQTQATREDTIASRKNGGSEVVSKRKPDGVLDLH